MLFRKFFHSSNHLKHFPIRSCSTVFEPKINDPPAFVDYGIHNIRVTGKVLNIFQQKNDKITFYMRSLVDNKSKRVHKILASNRNAVILDLAKRLKPEQNVSVEGKLNTFPIQTDEGKTRHVSAIVATELCIIAIDSNSNDSETVISDSNRVELLGTIITNVVGNNSIRSFTLATVRNPLHEKKDPKNLCCNRIFVYDESLYPLLKDLNIKHDMFLVRGHIGYRLQTDQFGKVTTTSYVVAEQLYRV